jgi:GT2 family glycosyltransferase
MISDASQPELSIIIVNYNTRQLLTDCLDSLLIAEPPPGGMEIIVVDNASSDGSPEMVRAEYPAVKLVANRENVGFSAANNQGTAVAQAPYLLFLNSDTRLEPRALVEPLAYLQANPQVGAITVKLIYPNGQRDPDNHRGFPTPWNALCHFSGLSRLFPHSPRFNGYFQRFADFDQTHTVPVIAGSFMMMPRALFDQLGGWDETYFFTAKILIFATGSTRPVMKLFIIPTSPFCTTRGPAPACARNRPILPGRPKRRASRWRKSRSGQ